jgi:hypothetical protein
LEFTILILLRKLPPLRPDNPFQKFKKNHGSGFENQSFSTINLTSKQTRIP